MSKVELDISGLKFTSDGFSVSNSTGQVAGTKELPIYMEVDTGIDYAAVVTGVAGLVVAIMVARFTMGVQRNQIQANVSTLRHHWMTELRSCSSELLQTMSVLTNHMKQVEKYKGSPEYVEQMKVAIILENKVALLLSRDDNRSKGIMDAIRHIMVSINNLKHNQDNKSIFSSMNDLKHLFRAELENAWDDIKNDLGINRKYLGIRLVSEKKAKDK
ncbi:hypothetical protein HU761_19235 [Pseudomonas sp. SWRI59]|uniref:hypothetical protein n=1 Tax=unclassified Pseudomonas TaxID=196821 RepID=UPI0016473C8D|nr:MULTISPECIES: hypothetical protein [unclassified Pseudomonas]MBC3503534.1 hypothetical protein [Pseudomonas sp. SWRI59]MBC3507495.1 hypothetical protein [Pseudomonas sp. SWRI68]